MWVNLPWNNVRAKFHENSPNGEMIQKLVGGIDTRWYISLTFLILRKVD